MDLSQWALPWIVTLFVTGLALLFGGGHFLVAGSSKLARILGIHPLIVGLTIVALGTSMPEFLVSMFAAIQGKTDVALGNIIGSNVSNISLILGVSALARPIDVHLKLLKFELPLVAAVSVLFWVVCANDVLSRLDGLLLFVGFIIYLIIVISGARKGSEVHEEKYKSLSGERQRKTPQVIAIVIGITCLSFGADWIVDAASEMSRRFGISELILGLTIIALGTSLPELATSLVAALKNEGDISIGNIIGSNIFNMMAIAGPSAVVHPLPVSAVLRSNHLPIMVGLTLLMFPLLRTGRKLGRLEGVFLLLCYLGVMYWWITQGDKTMW